MSEQKIEFYKGAAGGWGALRSVSQALMRQDIAVKGIMKHVLAQEDARGGVDRKSVV
jgi:hypothetical protein